MNFKIFPRRILLTGMVSVFLLYGCESYVELPSFPVDAGDLLRTPRTVPGYNANRLFIHHGLQLHCWVSSESWFVVDVNDWDLAGFGGPTFFRAPLWNPVFMAARPMTQWSIAKGPYALNVDRGPTQDEVENGFLDETQLSRLGDLTTICFGDEEDYSMELMGYLKNWYTVSRRFYPSVMVHNNQWGSQWDETKLRMYVLMTQPDLITFDAYLFGPENPASYRGSREMAEYLMKYREIALAGLDGLGGEPIGFGQYIQGYRKEASFDMTESQLRLYYFMTWALGGKWLNWFRYLQGNDTESGTQPTGWCMLLENGIPGNPAEAMYWAKQCNLESRNLGDYLVRLETTDVYLVLGDFGTSGGIPRNVPLYTEAEDSCIKSVKAVVMGSDKTGWSGDVYIGFYRIIPAEENGDPGFFSTPDAQFFMLVNAFTSHQVVTAEDARQYMKVQIDIDDKASDCLKRVSRVNGQVETIPLTQVRDTLYEFEIFLPGGTGDLFYIE